MNARGLMELIILNIGLEKGLITSTLFTIMVLMAIITTVMASPLFYWIYGRYMAGQQTADSGQQVNSRLRLLSAVRCPLSVFVTKIRAAAR